MMEILERTGSPADAIDGVVPERVVWIRDAAEIHEVVRDALSTRRSIVPVGGATLLGIGNAPRHVGTRLDLSLLSTAFEHAPSDMVVTVAAGMTLAVVNERLAIAGQRVALSAAAPQTATVGGLAAADSAGGLAYRFGRPRDQILGMTVVDGRNRRLNVGGRVVKNVAGFDLPRLFIGSYGTLGVICELTLRTHPLPLCRDDVCLAFDDFTALDAARAALFASNLPISVIDMHIASRDVGARRMLRLVLEGTSVEVARQRERVGQLCRDGRTLSSSEAETELTATTSHVGDVVVRFTCRPSRSVALAAALIDASDASGVASRLTSECAGAVVRWYPELARTQDPRTAVAHASRVATDHKAIAVVEGVRAADKAGLDVWGRAPAGLEIMKRLKARFDPEGIFAPGRFVGGI